MKKKVLALSLILSLAALSGCAGDEKTNTTIPPRTSELAAAEPEKTSSETSGTEEIEPEREIKTRAQTHEELIAYLLTAFCEKDTEALESFGVDYDKSFNDLCKALDDTGNLPDDLSEIELSPEMFEIYYTINALGTVEQWSAAYPNMGGRFGFWFYFSDYNYSTQTYTMQNVKCKKLGNYSYFVKYADSDETWSGTVVKKVDITDYLD